MPPSPALRFSPGRELRAETHKRGRSLESGLLLREKDDNLALFNEMQAREKDNFLLQSSDDLDDCFSSKLRYFSDFKLGISIPVRGESSDLLNADGDKNDYDWLLTPPDTPLFPSLDDETPPVNIAPRGRPRSQPISISRSNTMEKSYRNSRSSASPHRLSPSPRSSNGTFRSRGRPSSAPHSSPTPGLRQSTPLQRPSTPPNKPATAAPRSCTPTPRRMSTGSTGIMVSSGRRGTSPVKSSRGNSASPKMRAWQANIPGFSSDAPPNLRTSLADRPASYVRGSSPASRNGSDASSKFRRQSMSPTASRSVSSSHSHDRDRFSSQSKGSVASSGDDDIDSLQSVPMGIANHSAIRKIGAFPSSRGPAFSKKPSRTISSSSAPKRSFDSALRQMDRRKSPQNMFRPLLSSVPSTTFYVGKSNSVHQPMISRNSSVTTSSNASSEQGTTIAPDIEGTDHDHDRDDIASELGNSLYPDAQEEVFVFDKVDEINEDVEHETIDGKTNIKQADFNRGTTLEVQSGESEHFSSSNAATAIASTNSEPINAESDPLEVDCHENLLLCSICGSKFRFVESMEGKDGLCPDCSEQTRSCTLAIPKNTKFVSQNTVTVQSEMNVGENKSFHEVKLEKEVPEFQESPTRCGTMAVQCENNILRDRSCNFDQSQSCLPDNSVPRSIMVMEEGKQHSINQQVVDQTTVVSCQSNSDTADRQFQHSSNHSEVVAEMPVGSSQSNNDIVNQQLQSFNNHASLKVDVSEGAGISVLLKRSSSSKWPVVQGRSFTATNIPYDDPSYARESVNSMRSSIGHGSASASSSVDWSSSRQTEARVHRQLSGRKADLENSRHDLNLKPHSTGSSSSGISSHAHQNAFIAKSTSEETSDMSVGNMEYEAVEEMPLVSDEEHTDSKNAELETLDSSVVRPSYFEDNKIECTESCRTEDVSASELSSCTLGIRLGDTSIAACPIDKDCVSSGIVDDFPNKTRSVSDIDALAITPDSSFRKEIDMLNSVCSIDDVDASGDNSLVTISGELENGHTQNDDVVSPNMKRTIDESLEHPLAVMLEEDKPNMSDHCHGILEESTITVEGPGGHKKRSLTLDEATDTILFCSSIVHNLAHQAASIAMEKENSVPLEGSRPTVTILGKSSSDTKGPRARTGSKRTPKSQKTRHRRVESDMETSPGKVKTDVKAHESRIHGAEFPNKVDSTKPPKLESKCNCTVM
ncbi:PREDICTED: uncharacterized protein LOC104592946 [Nelumbo nucifera]|uniref:Uncharacterized protein LOC104592946 n=2 Tax=Nelumbo nucifera TaxID=4432 RepID=A0A1U7ZDH0_NELNU|nr:PREDICTED: uncharacterized protein LOC104592946 [Nelumbo nucifera]DAD34309.1 TPA_asm: hypothetical protein HUJ06_004949 [Nelumbo nucifera]